MLSISPRRASANTSLPRATPESQGVSSTAIADFVSALDRAVDTPHSFMLLRHGHVIAAGWWKPQTPDTPHLMHSISKSFTSMAVGLAIADAKLKLDDPVLKFFPEDAPAHPSENLKAMTIRDLLTMTCGQDKDLPYKSGGPIPTVRQFLAHDVPHKPGTHFLYNTVGTYVLSAIVTKVTGQTVLEFLQPRLFEPLGIEKPYWQLSAEGYSIGGSGLKLRTEDVAKFGQLLLQRGQWNGRQLVPADWIDQATARQVPNANSSTWPDWQQGYGFQFWQCTHGAFRGDGANGQFCLVLRQFDAVLAITSDIDNAFLQRELNVAWDKLLPAFNPGAILEDPAAQERLRTTIASLAAHPAPPATTQAAK
jgi:CubicO group peptidase (beta-lactamase class C family)